MCSEQLEYFRMSSSTMSLGSWNPNISQISIFLGKHNFPNIHKFVTICFTDTQWVLPKATPGLLIISYITIYFPLMPCNYLTQAQEARKKERKFGAQGPLPIRPLWKSKRISNIHGRNIFSVCYANYEIGYFRNFVGWRLYQYAPYLLCEHIY